MILNECIFPQPFHIAAPSILRKIWVMVSIPGCELMTCAGAETFPVMTGLTRL